MACFAYFETESGLLDRDIAGLPFFVATVDFGFLDPECICADVPTLDFFDVGEVGVAVVWGRTGAVAPVLGVFAAGCVGVAVLVLRTGVPAPALVGGGATTREPLFSSPGRVASLASVG